MNDFIKIYKTNNNLTIHNNPFIKAALAHLLFIRIHPYVDGNGRTARMIHNIKFTELINKMYNMKLKICPLNISQNIQINKLTYCNCIDNIKFNNKDNDNEALNNWFDFTLTMADEQLYYIKSRINKYSYMLEKLSTFKTDTDEHLLQEANKMKIKRQD